MLKPRVIIVLQLNDGVLFRTREFRPDYRYTMNFVGAANADEVVILDITRNPTPESRSRFYAVAAKYASQCFTPISVGGHIQTLAEIRMLMTDVGADKVVVGSQLWRDPGFGPAIAEKFGRQMLTAAVDYRNYQAFYDQGSMSTGYTARGAAQELYDIGAGEILLTSIERDGSLSGYDLDTVKWVSDAVNIPVIANGGCGNGKHMAEAFKAGASGAATANIFHITDTGLASFKRQIADGGIEVRP